MWSVNTVKNSVNKDDNRKETIPSSVKTMIWPLFPSLHDNIGQHNFRFLSIHVYLGVLNLALFDYEQVMSVFN